MDIYRVMFWKDGLRHSMFCQAWNEDDAERRSREQFGDGIDIIGVRSSPTAISDDQDD